MVAPRVDTILEIKDHIAAYVGLLSGQFDEQIAKLEATKKAAEQRLAQADALDTFDQVKASVEAFKAQRMQEIEDAAQALKDFEASLKIKESALAVSLKQFQTERQDFLKAVQEKDLVITQNLADSADAKRQAEMALSKAQEQAKALDAKEAEVEAREAEVQRKLDVLKNI